jgi:hypothetical protein
MPGTQTVMLPTGAPATSAMRPAERPKSLSGLRVGLLDNGKEFSDVVLDALAEILRRDHGVTNIKFWRKGFPAKGAPFIAEMAAETDVAISGVGHCGSSSPWSVARKPWGMVRNRGKSKGPVFPAWVDQNDENAMVPIINEPRDLIVVVAGGAGGKSMWCPTAGAQSLSVSKRIERRG